MKTFYGESLIHKDELIQHGIFGEIKIKYYKISRNNECKKYGIEITKNNTEESEIVTNITNNEETINMILEKLGLFDNTFKKRKKDKTFRPQLRNRSNRWSIMFNYK